MKWINRTEKETEIIGTILDSYSVKYKVTDSEDYSKLSDIEANITPEFYAFLCKEIDEKIKEYKKEHKEPNIKDIANLEYMYELDPYIPSTEVEYGKELSAIDKKIKEIETAMSNRLRELTCGDFMDGIKDMMGSLLTPSTISLSISSELTQKFMDLDIPNEAKERLKNMITKNINDALSNITNNHKGSTPEEIAEELKVDLQKRMPEVLYGLVKIKVNGKIIFE